MTTISRKIRTAVAMAGVIASASSGVLADRVDPSEVKDRTEPVPKRLQGIDVKEALNEPLPLDVPFVDEDGESVKLGDYFNGKKPVIVTFNYSDCPMLCSLQLNALTDALKGVEETMGDAFDVVTIGLDPTEKPARARSTRDRYVEQYGRPAANAGWHFLTGPESSARTVAGAVGFQYGYNEARDEWVHPAAFIVATPDGRIARYLYGIQYHPKTLRLSVLEASEGKIGSTIDRLILYCFHYDADEGRYAPVAMNIMRLGGGLTVAALGGFLAVAWSRERRRKNKRGSLPATGSAQ